MKQNLVSQDWEHQCMLGEGGGRGRRSLGALSSPIPELTISPLPLTCTTSLSPAPHQCVSLCCRIPQLVAPVIAPYGQHGNRVTHRSHEHMKHTQISFTLFACVQHSALLPSYENVPSFQAFCVEDKGEREGGGEGRGGVGRRGMRGREGERRRRRSMEYQKAHHSDQLHM